LSAATQQEAQELLSVTGQLSHHPSLAKTLLPPSEVIWGLAALSLTPGGRDKIARIVGVQEHAIDGVLTQAGLADLLNVVLERDGVATALETYNAWRTLVMMPFEPRR
jgi:hypothetical protein